MLLYDEVNFKIYIKPDGAAPIEFSMLSSGEKQIVSLFSHLYLSESQFYYVLIDEPELSLSVEWQNMLLPDIWNSGRCKFLLAVTHSPFICENEFDKYATDMKITKGDYKNV
jgi:predicted ATPase